MKRNGQGGFFAWTVLEIVFVGLFAVTCITGLLGNAVQSCQQSMLKDQALQVAICTMEEGKEKILKGEAPPVGSWKRNNFTVMAEREAFLWQGVGGEIYSVAVYGENEKLLSLSTKYCY